jgi:hypothetical protein
LGQTIHRETHDARRSQQEKVGQENAKKAGRHPSPVLPQIWDETT